MKRKLLFVVALAASALGFNANAEDWKDIENGNGLVFEKQYAVPTNGDVRETWTPDDGDHQFDLKQEVNNIPDGVYELSVNAMYRASLDYGTETNCVLYAEIGGKTYSTPICNFGDWTSLEKLGNGNNNDSDRGGITSVMQLYDAYKNVMYVFVKGGTATIGMKNTGKLARCTNGYWFVWKNSSFKFKKVTATYLETLKTRANAMLESAQNDAAKTALSAAVSSATEASVESIETLQAAIDKFFTSASSDNPIDVTSYMANPGFEEGVTSKMWIQDMGYKQPADFYIPNGWNLVYSSAKNNNVEWQSFNIQTENAKYGNCLYVRHGYSDAKIVENLHQIVRGLPKGMYTLTVAVKGSNSTTDPNTLSLTAGQVSEQTVISEFTVDNYKDYSVTIEKEEGDALDICYGLEQKGSSQLYWIDDFRLTYLGEVTIEQAKEMLGKEISAATVMSKANVGSGAFQIPPSEVTELTTAIAAAEEVYGNVQASVEDVKKATAALKAAEEAYTEKIKETKLNEPAEGTRFTISPASADHAMANNVVTITYGSFNNNPTGYSFKADSPANVNRPQAFIFTNANDTEHPNYYHISIEREGEYVYLTNGTQNNSTVSWASQQIQGNTSEDAKLAFEIIPLMTEEGYNLKNTGSTADEKLVAIQANGSMYTETQNGGTNNLMFKEADKASVSISVSKDKHATAIFPFAPTLPSDVKANTIASIDEEGVITLAKADNLAANVPYILSAETNVTATVEGFGIADKDSYTDAAGILTGVYTEEKVPVDSYVLQTQNDVQAFYIVKSPLTAVPYRAYLTRTGVGVKAFYFGTNGDATAIKGVETVEGAENAVIYNLAGQRVVNPTKGGIYIVNGQKVLVK